MNTNDYTVDIRTIHDFLNAAQGNWRNSVYVECSLCKHCKKVNCNDFLFVPGFEGAPILMPVSDVAAMTGTSIDKSECLLVMSNTKFYALFSLWFKLNTDSEKMCPFISIIEQQKTS